MRFINWTNNIRVHAKQEQIKKKERKEAWRETKEKGGKRCGYSTREHIPHFMIISHVLVYLF